MAELADAADSKSAEVYPSWGFDPPSRHHAICMKTSPVPTAPLRSGFMPELNGLRAIAIILVFLNHTIHWVPGGYFPVTFLHAYLGQGWVGVDLFFVLSGFLITGILLDTKDAKNYFRAFYARRILRIFPLYYVVLTAVILIGIKLHNDDVSAVLPLPEDRWLYYCYLTNWLGLWKAHWGPDYANYLAHFWSLAVEEQFYLVWPLLVWLLPRQAIIWTASSLAVFAAIFRLGWLLHSGPQIAIALATITRMDSLFVGAICAVLFREPATLEKLKPWLPRIAFACLGLFLLAFSILNYFPDQVFPLIFHDPDDRTLQDATTWMSEAGGYSLLALGFGAVVLMAAVPETLPRSVQRFLRTRLMAETGLYSYGIYVYHVPLIGAASFTFLPLIIQGHHFLKFKAVFAIALIAVITILLAGLSYNLFEKPLLDLKKHFKPRFDKGTPPASTSVSQP